MRLSLCVLALAAVLAAPTAAAESESCPVVEITGDPPGVYVHPDCLPVPLPGPVRELIWFIQDLIDP